MTVTELITAATEFITALPAHKCELTIVHNPQTCNYENVEQYIDRTDHDFSTIEQRQRAISTDELWLIAWYPDTPVGFYEVAAPTLGEALAAAVE